VGKSTTVARILVSLTAPEIYPSARIVVLDIHGEYARALGDQATVFRVNPSPERGERHLYIPYWALTFDEFLSLALGDLDDRARAGVLDKIIELKHASLRSRPRTGVEPNTLNVDIPVPFSVHKLWLELHRTEHATYTPKPGEASEEFEEALVLDGAGQPVQAGDALTVTPPMYRSVKTSGPRNQQVQWGRDTLNIRRQLAGLASKLRDPRFDFTFRPGPWLPTEAGLPAADLDTLLEQWIGDKRPVSILDLSGVPPSILNPLIGAVLRIIYDAMFWARNLSEGARERPLLFVLEEAHAYLGQGDTGGASVAVRRIVKEGRKYGVGAMIVSQRPAEIDSTILSQCGTIFAMRLSNSVDRAHVTSSAPDYLEGLFAMLPVLRTGEVIIAGEGVRLPLRALVPLPAHDRRPESEDPRVIAPAIGDEKFKAMGGWDQGRPASDYSAVVAHWRRQDARVTSIVDTSGAVHERPSTEGD
jgi:hypothetical protein